MGNTQNTELSHLIVVPFDCENENKVFGWNSARKRGKVRYYKHESEYKIGSKYMYHWQCARNKKLTKQKRTVFITKETNQISI